MATLWERITGQLPNEPPAGDEKIHIHPFMAAMREWEVGQYTRAQIITGFNIQSSQEAQLDSLKSKFNNATDQKEFMQVFKDLAYLAEHEYDYLDVADVNTRLDLVP